MTAISLVRAAHVIALALAVTSLGQVWGVDLDVGKGPPKTWERQVVGVILLVGLSLVVGFGRASFQSLWTKLTVAATSGAALFLCVSIRSGILEKDFDHLLKGKGFYLLFLGASLCAAAVLCRLLLPKPPSGKNPARKKAQAR